MPGKYVKISIDSDDVKNQIDKLLKEGYDSFLSLNINCSFKCIAALNKLGVVIPEEARMISFDDSDMFEYVNPPISALACSGLELNSKTQIIAIKLKRFIIKLKFEIEDLVKNF